MSYLKGTGLGYSASKLGKPKPILQVYFPVSVLLLLTIIASLTAIATYSITSDLVDRQSLID